jgi:hypothetical protein
MRRFVTFAALIALQHIAGAQPADPQMQPPGAVPPEQQPTQPPQQMQPQQPMQPQRPMQPPPGSTRASFISMSEMQWDVTLGGQPVCATPCQLWVPPLAFVSMHSQEMRPSNLEVGYLQGGDVMVAAEPMHKGEFATGVTFTTLGGMALITGIALGATGYGTGDRDMQNAGFITGVSGAVVLAGSIWLINHALPKAHVRLNGTF